MIPGPQQIYRHFKGKIYQIITIAEHSETGEKLVIYQAMYDDFKIYARPLEEFISKVDRDKYPEAVQEYRFELIGDVGQSVQKETVQKETVQKEILQKENSVESKAEVPVVQQEEPTEGEAALDPLVLQFLDAASYEERLGILAGLHHRITNDMITTMAIVCDIEVPEGDVEERYEGLRSCLLTLEKYECNRLR